MSPEWRFRIARNTQLIEHNSINQMNFRVEKSCKDDYILVPYRLDQYNIFNSNLPLEEMIISAISNLELHIDKIKEKIVRGRCLSGYAGIANIPMTFLLGYELGDENRKLYFINIMVEKHQTH